MSLLVVGTMAFDAIETPFGKTDKILGGAATYISLAASNICKDISVVSVVGGDFPEEPRDRCPSQRGPASLRVDRRPQRHPAQNRTRPCRTRYDQESVRHYTR